MSLNSSSSNSSIQKKFLALGGLALALTIALAISGFWGLGSVVERMDENGVTAAALRNHLESDMMHDALRADVLSAFIAMENGSEKEKAEVRANLEEHIAAFFEGMAANEALPLAPKVKQALGKVKGPLESYATAAKAIINKTFQDRAAGAADMPAFAAAFEELEGAMAAVSDLIEGSVQAAQADGTWMATLANIVMAVAAVLALAVVGGLYLFTAKGVLRPINQMASAMNTLADGNNEIDVPSLDRRDEIGNMASAVEVFKQNAVERERLEAQQKQEHAATEERARAIESLIGTFDDKVSNVLGAVGDATTEMEATAQNMSRIAETTSQDRKSVV